MATGVPGADSGADSGRSDKIAIMHGTYAWGKSPESAPILSDITLSVPRGALCIVVGTVGSGKSSLLAAMLGEMHCVTGSTVVEGSVAFTAQVCNSGIATLCVLCMCVVSPQKVEWHSTATEKA